MFYYRWQKDIREEDRRYREYLRQLREEERRREKEMEVLCDAEVEKMWDKRVAQWKIEKMARQKLLQQVVESRRQQIQEKCGSHFFFFFDFHLAVASVSPMFRSPVWLFVYSSVCNYEKSDTVYNHSRHKTYSWRHALGGSVIILIDFDVTLHYITVHYIAVYL